MTVEGGGCVMAKDMTGVFDDWLWAGLFEQAASPQTATRVKANEARA